MQNIDFYEGRNFRNIAPQADSFDPEYFTRAPQQTSRDPERKRKRASRMFFLIASLCIISFTTGIVLGLKFAGGPKKAIMDEQTKQAVNNVGEKMTSLINGAKSSKSLFPRQEYPFVIKAGADFDAASSQEIANFLSRRGHTVILSKSGGKYRIFTGPYKTSEEAQDSLKKITAYKDFSLAKNLKVLKR